MLVYCRQARDAYPDVPQIIGGLEESLRRFAHYDYWDDRVRPSILIESGADLLVYGMGEAQTAEIARRLREGGPISSMTDIRGTCFSVPVKDYIPRPAAECPRFELAAAPTASGKRQYAVSCRIQQEEQDAVRGRTVIQRHGERMLVQNPPMPPLSTEEFDRVYELPYMRDVHPSTLPMGGVPGIEEVRFSITHNRGCIGGCHFCSLAFHQGRQITCRSEDSVVREAEALTRLPGFKGYIHDVGGPTANFRHPSCKGQLTRGLCKNKQCLAPAPCPAMEADHRDYLHLLRRLRALPGIKKVFIRSGIRYDYLMADPDESFFRELVAHHISGQLKVAPEHCVAHVLDAMGKPHIQAYEKFRDKYQRLNQKYGMNQFLVPYLMSSHPGATLADAIAMAQWINKTGRQPEQVQDFYPTPGTLATGMYYTGLDPRTMKPIYVPKTPHEKELQRALLQWKRPEKRRLVLEALHREGREDLIGYGPDCLLRPNRPGKPEAAQAAKSGKPGKTQGRGKAPAKSQGRGQHAPAPQRGKSAGKPTSRSPGKTQGKRRK